MKLTFLFLLLSTVANTANFFGWKKSKPPLTNSSSAPDRPNQPPPSYDVDYSDAPSQDAWTAQASVTLPFDGGELPSIESSIECIKNSNYLNRRISICVVDPAQTVVAIVDHEQCIKLWDLKTLKLLKAIMPNNPDQILRVSFTEKSTQIMVHKKDGLDYYERHIIHSDVSNQENSSSSTLKYDDPVSILNRSIKKIGVTQYEEQDRRVAYSAINFPQSTMIAIVDDLGVIKLWCISTGRNTLTIASKPWHPITDIKFTDEGDEIVVTRTIPSKSKGGFESTFEPINVVTRDKKIFDDSSMNIDFSWDNPFDPNMLLTVNFSNGELNAWDKKQKTCVYTHTINETERIIHAYSPTATTVFLITKQHRPKILDIPMISTWYGRDAYGPNASEKWLPYDKASSETLVKTVPSIDGTLEARLYNNDVIRLFDKETGDHIASTAINYHNFGFEFCKKNNILQIIQNGIKCYYYPHKERLWLVSEKQAPNFFPQFRQ
jgi:hypothetical protein